MYICMHVVIRGELVDGPRGLRPRGHRYKGAGMDRKVTNTYLTFGKKYEKLNKCKVKNHRVIFSITRKRLP